MHVDAAERADRNRSRALARLVAGPSMHDKIPAVWSIRCANTATNDDACTRWMFLSSLFAVYLRPGNCRK